MAKSQLVIDPSEPKLLLMVFDHQQQQVDEHAEKAAPGALVRLNKQNAAAFELIEEPLPLAPAGSRHQSR